VPVTRIPSRPLLLAPLAGIALVVACSATESWGPFVDVSGPAPPGVAGVAPPGTVAFESPCPGFDAPIPGSACSRMQTSSAPWDGTCEYGHDLDRKCNDVFQCSGGWRQLARNDCFGRCPDTIDTIVLGSACSDVTVGCSYLEGTCACVPDGDTDADDGGLDAGGGPVAGRWRCAPPPGNGCPAQRPSIGSDCVKPMTCDYGACALGREVVYSCLSTRRWVQDDFPESCN
jgi:hypothetical protein